MAGTLRLMAEVESSFADLNNGNTAIKETKKMPLLTWGSQSGGGE